MHPRAPPLAMYGPDILAAVVLAAVAVALAAVAVALAAVAVALAAVAVLKVPHCVWVWAIHWCHGTHPKGCLLWTHVWRSAPAAATCDVCIVGRSRR